MTQPEIKKYHRKVSDERVEKVTLNAYGFVTDYRKTITRMILEADAEVIEGKCIEKDIHYDMIRDAVQIHSFIEGKYKIDVFKREQFNAEWEEIE
jgi:phage terminase small subunit